MICIMFIFLFICLLLLVNDVVVILFDISVTAMNILYYSGWRRLPSWILWGMEFDVSKLEQSRGRG